MIRIRDLEFETAKAAAAHFGVTPHQIRLAARRGTLDKVGLRMTVVVRGQFFPSVRACAEHFGVSISNVHSQVERCRADWIGTGTARPGAATRCKPIKIGKRSFESMAEADRVLGLCSGYVSRAKRGVRGYFWERVIGASMALDAKERRARDAAENKAALAKKRSENAAARAAAAGLSIATE